MTVPLFVTSSRCRELMALHSDHAVEASEDAEVSVPRRTLRRRLRVVFHPAVLGVATTCALGGIALLGIG